MFWPVFLLFLVLLLEGLGDDVNVNDGDIKDVDVKDVNVNDGNDPVDPSVPQKKPGHVTPK